MKIAIVGPFFYPQIDGVEKVMLSHAKHLARRGHEVHVLTSDRRFPAGRFSGLPSVEIHEGFTIHRIRILLRSPTRLFYYLSNSGVLLKGLGSLLHDLGPDIIHVHNVAAPAWAYVAARYAERNGKKLFYSLHYHPDCLDLSKLHTCVLHHLNRLPITASKRLFHLTIKDFDTFGQEYPFADRARFAVLRNGVEPAMIRVRPIEPNAQFRLLFVGRVEDPRKGFDILREAFASSRRSGWTLTVLGRIGQKLRAALEDQFGHSVRVLGLVDEATLEREYAKADVFVMPSRYEGFGMPFIEAMRYRLPVIGTNVGGIPEVVPEGTGVLVPPDDSIALSEAIIRLSKSFEERKRLGLQGEEWARQFQWSSVIDDLERHYSAC